MDAAEWIIVGILAGALLVFLIVGTILLVKLIDFTKEARKIIITGQRVAEKTDDIVDNVKDMTTIGGLFKTFVQKVSPTKPRQTKSKPKLTTEVPNSTKTSSKKSA